MTTTAQQKQGGGTATLAKIAYRNIWRTAFCFVAAIFFVGCPRPVNENVAENPNNTAENLTKWAKIYQITLNSYLEQDPALNENVDFIAVDLSTLEFADDNDKKAIVAWIELKHAPVKNTNLDGLRAENLFDGMRIPNGVFLTINKITERENEIIIDGMKYRGARAANWFRTNWRFNSGAWEFVETTMTMIS
ncbi:MAG: hypothetical protein FWE23_03615 [Chitinivibrionia bacterium]|nr:hypothetical protein [Chitinivibrionia bacterium]